MSTEESAVEVCDPAQVTSVPELAECMRCLLRRRGMSYSALIEKTEKLPRRNGKLLTLPKSTVSDMLSGKRVPPKDRLLTLLMACQVSQDDVPLWIAAWERARASWDTALKSPPQPPRTQWWRPFIVPVTVTAILSAAMTAVAFWASSQLWSHDTSPPHTAALVVVQNKYADGRSEMIDYETEDPRATVYLSTKPAAYCARRGCKVENTDMHSGALLPVVCHIKGEKMYNYNLDSPYQNPNRAESTLWYRGVFPDGRTGYLNEVKVTEKSRGGLGLPDCTKM